MPPRAALCCCLQPCVRLHFSCPAVCKLTYTAPTAAAAAAGLPQPSVLPPSVSHLLFCCPLCLVVLNRCGPTGRSGWRWAPSLRITPTGSRLCSVRDPMKACTMRLRLGLHATGCDPELQMQPARMVCVLLPALPCDAALLLSLVESGGACLLLLRPLFLLHLLISLLQWTRREG